ncbi:hypothetical protein RchiOBHm_Chr6g0296901 [Rosa chinensis]|uniref:Uncharacterized protein n=1 Tax=Rosa chinensis TaxID=74649 RepID=A0A2P6PXJ7_ROSCH|nr:hypothetical protein RchiOBHm_Chr6g0296901 [Rosa chinensis]
MTKSTVTQNGPNPQTFKICMLYFWPHLATPTNPLNDFFILPMKLSVRSLFSLVHGEEREKIVMVLEMRERERTQKKN